MKKMKCIKHKCPYYFESDNYFEVCQLVSKYCIVGNCIGVNAIKPKMEELACKISKLTTEYSTLSYLEDWIKDNQEEL